MPTHYRGAAVKGETLDLSQSVVMGSSFVECTLIAETAVCDLGEGLNVYQDCQFVGAAWPAYIQITDAWRPSL